MQKSVRKHFVSAGKAIAIEMHEDVPRGVDIHPDYAFESEPEYADYLAALCAAYSVEYDSALKAAREGFKVMVRALAWNLA